MRWQAEHFASNVFFVSRYATTCARSSALTSAPLSCIRSTVFSQPALSNVFDSGRSRP